MVSDRVMGGVGDGAWTLEDVAGCTALRLTCTVSTENGGGFRQIARDMAQAGGREGVELRVIGNGEAYNLHLKTDALEKPWQSFRAGFRAGPEWTSLRIPFAALTPHRTDAGFDPSGLRCLGLVAISRPFAVDLALARLSLYGGN